MSKAKAVIIDGHITTRKTIVEADLIAVETARSKVAALKAELAQAEITAGVLEDDVLLRLKAGAKVVGRLTAIVKRMFGPRRPNWKDLFLDHMSSTHGDPRDSLEQAVIEKCVGSPRDALIVGVKPGKSS